MHSPLARVLEGQIRVFRSRLVDGQRHLGSGGKRNAISKVHFVDTDFKLRAAKR